MIYLIDDKRSRRESYGWSDERLKNYSDILQLVETSNQFKEIVPNIEDEDSVILYHESFWKSVSKSVQEEYKALFSRLNEGNELKIAWFSGSYNHTTCSDETCSVNPSKFYANLDVFLEDYKDNGNLPDFKLLAYGKNADLELKLESKYNSEYSLAQDRLNERSKAGLPRLVADGTQKILFLESKRAAVQAPFASETNWDTDTKQNTDTMLHNVVLARMNSEKYDRIFVPLCFGHSFTDYVGLRLAAHIRLTSSLNQYTPIYIYGEFEYRDIWKNECFNILKCTGVYTCPIDYDSLVEASRSVMASEEEIKDLHCSDTELLQINIPNHYGDNHSIANVWGADVFNKQISKDVLTSSLSQEISKSLYYKYLIAKTNSSLGKDGVENLHGCTVSGMSEAWDKNILLIDDEASKGWEEVLKKWMPHSIIKTCDQKVDSFEDLPEDVKAKVESHFYDLYIIDLRLKGAEEEHILDTQNFSGYKMLKKIKNVNQGNQVVIMTASNKAWNMYALLRAGADGYYIKESPDFLNSSDFSKQNYTSFASSVKRCLRNSLLRKLYVKLDRIKQLSEAYSQSFIDCVSNNISIAFNLLQQAMKYEEGDSLRNKNVAFSFLQLYLIIEEFLKLEDVFYKSEVSKNKWDCYVNGIDGLLVRNSDNESVLMFENGHYKIEKHTIDPKVENVKVDTNFGMSALLLFRYGATTSGEHDWTKIYKIRNNKTAHPETNSIDICSEYELIIDFLLFILDTNNISTLNNQKALQKPTEEEMLTLLLNKFSNTKNRH